MDSDDVYMENDPLALYLKSENLDDFEIITRNPNENLNTPLPLRVEQRTMYLDETSQDYIEELLRSELLLEEDYHLLETYSLNSIGETSRKSTLKYTLNISAVIVGVTVYKCTSFKLHKAVLPLFTLPVFFDIYSLTKRYIKRRKISGLLYDLNTFKNLVKKSLQIVAEISTSIDYYSASTVRNLSLTIVHSRFAKEFYFLLLSAIKLLVRHASQIMSLIPLTITNNVNFEIKGELLNKSDITLSDIKLLSEVYLLVQSDFVKTLGLSFCSSLWASIEPNTEQVLSEVVPVVRSSMNEICRLLSKEYTILRDFGLTQKRDTGRTVQKNITSPIHFMNSCLHSTELHFQQLLCKSRDLQDIIAKIEKRTDSTSTELAAKMLDEIDKQITSSKNLIETVMKCFNQFTKRETSFEVQISAEKISSESFKPAETEGEEVQPEKLLYELYIPKEGLNVSEVGVDTERSVFSMRDLDYSGVLMEELRAILKTRNLDVYQEEMARRKLEIQSESEDEEEFYESKRKDIFRPTQPAGLAESLQSISHVLSSRKNMLQCEEICDDIYSSSDIE